MDALGAPINKIAADNQSVAIFYFHSAPHLHHLPDKKEASFLRTVRPVNLSSSTSISASSGAILRQSSSADPRL